MSSRDAILAALGQVKLPQQPMPAINVQMENVDFVEQFKETLAKVGGSLHEVTSLDEVQAYLDKEMADDKPVIARVAGLKGNRALDDTPHDLQDVHLSIVEAELGVAKNGAVLVRETATGQRVLPYISEHFAVVLKRDTIVPTMHQAAPKVNLEVGQHAAFIAGPSKTADIEQALVIGAHGACSMAVFLMD